MNKKRSVLIIVAIVAGVLIIGVVTVALLRQRSPRTPQTQNTSDNQATKTPTTTLEKRALEAEKKGSTALKDDTTTLSEPTIQDAPDHSTLSDSESSSPRTDAEKSLDTQGTEEPSTPPQDTGVGGGTN